jgi:hypothetical protein
MQPNQLVAGVTCVPIFPAQRKQARSLCGLVNVCEVTRRCTRAVAVHALDLACSARERFAPSKMHETKRVCQLFASDRELSENSCPPIPVTRI